MSPSHARQIASVRFDNEPHDARFAAKPDILESQFLTQTNIRCDRGLSAVLARILL